MKDRYYCKALYLSNWFITVDCIEGGRATGKLWSRQNWRAGQEVRSYNRFERKFNVGVRDKKFQVGLGCGPRIVVQL